MKCKHCGEEIFFDGFTWKDKGLVFPQYCQSETPSERLHEQKIIVEIEDYPCVFCGWIDGEHSPGCPYEPQD